MVRVVIYAVVSCLTIFSQTVAYACEKYQILEIQKVLNLSGYDVGSPDGMLGPKTTRGLIESGVDYANGITETQCDKILSFLLSRVSPQRIVAGPYTQTDMFSSSSVQGQRVIRYLYPINVDDDPEEELVIAGFQSQGRPDPEPKQTIMNIFDWNKHGYLVSRSDLFSDVQDQFFGGVGDLASGDFNGDGRTDMFLSGYTDSNYHVPVYALYGGKTNFLKVQVDEASWQHGVSAADLDGDGFDDVIATGYQKSPAIYFGGKDGLQKFSWSDDSYPNGSGILATDLNGDNQIEVVITDNSKKGGRNDRDVNIYRIFIDKNKKEVALLRLSSLPLAELEKPFWNSYFSTKKRKSHDIRIKSEDIDADGKKDLILFSVARSAYKGTDRNLSTVQVFTNQGGLKFFDYTKSFLFGYRNRTNVSYAPILRDLNSDQRLDLYSSEHDYDGFANSLQIFLSTNDRKLISIPEENTREILPVSGSSEISTVLIGKNNKPFIVRHVIQPGYGKKEYLAYRPLLFE